MNNDPFREVKAHFQGAGKALLLALLIMVLVYVLK